MTNPDNHGFNSSVEKVTEDVQKEYKHFLNQLEDLRSRCYPLFQELSLGPSYTEGRDPKTFKNLEFKRGLTNRLDSFKRRLTGEYPDYKEIISLYCLLYTTLEINPFNIKKTAYIAEILGKINKE